MKTGFIRTYGVPAGLAGLLSFALGMAHLMPGVGYWDTGEMQTVAPVFGVAHPTGYPAYVVLGWLASIVLQPLGEPAVRMNVLSAILLGATSALTAVLCVRLTGRPLLGLAGGIVLALAPEAWYLATHADPHALHACLLALLLLLLVVWGDRRREGAPRTDRWLVAAAIVFGVSLGNQALALLLVPGIALYVLVTDVRILRRPLFVVGCLAVAAGTGALLYLQLPLAVALGRPLIYGRPGTLGGFLYVVLGEQFRGSFGNPFADPGGTVGTMIDAVTRQLGWLALAVPAAAVATAVLRPRYFLLTAPAFVATLVFAAVYVNAEIDRYHLGPVLLAVTWLVIGAGWIVDVVEDAVRSRRERGGDIDAEPTAASGDAEQTAASGDAGQGGDVGADTPAEPAVRPSRGAVVTAIVLVALAAALVAPALARIPSSEETASSVSYLDARAWLDDALTAMEPNATIVSWWAYSTPLWYGTIVQGRRPDIRIVDDRTRLDQDLGEVADVIRADLGKRPVYLLRQGAEIKALEEEFVLELVPLGSGAPIYRVLGVKGAGS